MAKETTKLSYGRPFMRKLMKNANSLGNNITFYTNEDGKYVINDGKHIHKPPTAASACHFLMGVISASMPK